MKPFTYERAQDVAGAVKAFHSHTESHFLAGGTNLIDLMKYGVEQPTHLIDINRLPLSEVSELPGGGVRIGAMVRNSELANHRLIRTRYPLLSEALLAGATTQLRNAATVGGNLLQRTRCYYFMDTGFGECNKRKPGSGCGAKDGFNRIHAILGASEKCIATNPSDMSVALAALGATVRVQGASGERTIPILDFHRLPGDKPEIDTTLQPGELITAVDLPAKGYAQHFHYLKIRDRASYAFALVSVAAALELEGKEIRDVRFALGGVAHKPWRVPEVEQSLIGKQLDRAVLLEAGERIVSGAKAYQHNGFKIEVAKRAVARALLTAGARA